MQAYKNKLEALGYKVKMFPYQLLGSHIIN
jgi:hypothetical protein